jgi:hypothetical protein
MDLDILFLLISLAIGILGLFMLSVAWGMFGLCFAACLGIWEAVSKIRTGRTLTQRFKKLLKDNSWKAYAAIIGLNIFWICLMIHLLRNGGLWK